MPPIPVVSDTVLSLAEEKHLGLWLGRFISSENPRYDSEFRNLILDMFPSSNQREELQLALLNLGRRVEKSDGKLYTVRIRYTAPSSGSYDPEFVERYNERYPVPDRLAERKRELLELGHRATETNDPALHRWLVELIAPRGRLYDSEFAERYNTLYPARSSALTKKRNMEDLLGRNQRIERSDPLYSAFSNYYWTDPAFREKYDQRYPVKRPQDKKQQLLELGHRVDRTDPELGTAYRAYTSPSHGCYDPEFKRQYDEKYPPTRRPRTPKPSSAPAGPA